jgi:hypothetical protein
MTPTEKLVSLGRFMLDKSELFVDDALYNNWTRVGQMLVHIGTPFCVQFKDFEKEDRAVCIEAAKMMQGTIPLPESKDVMGRERIKRPPRMTKALTKHHQT